MVSSEKDLGTRITDSLSLTPNTHALAKNANFKLALLSRAIGKFPISSFAKLFSTLVRPSLEVNIQACCPYLKKDTNALESVQRRATKRVYGLSNLSYDDRLKQLKMFPLSFRRARGDLIWVYRILNTPAHPNNSLLELAPTTQLRGNGLKLSTHRSRLQCRQFSFSVRVISLWNALPEYVVLAHTLDCFKKNLDSWLLPKWPINVGYC